MTQEEAKQKLYMAINEAEKEAETSDIRYTHDEVMVILASIIDKQTTNVSARKSSD